MLNTMMKKSAVILAGQSALAFSLMLQPTISAASEPFVGEIRMFAGNFAPSGWALANGQLLAISQNDALFSLYGTIYGGDGRTTFGLPGMRGRVAIGMGSGPGLPTYRIGQSGGSETVTLTTSQLPAHTHALTTNVTAQLHASSQNGDQNSPAGHSIAPGHARVNDFGSAAPDVDMNSASIVVNGNVVPEGLSGAAGGNQAINNMMPYQAINQIVSLFGIYPSRQ